ncbi:MAG TPA: hypothetical protein VM621_19005 [Luteibacter sp.]|uniref:hypothetical protein n=1 Tax=Luteibacter sp. TaxID=1886636 RepID=UPI002CE2D40C|nr:hypothetical protein [Luteibacter sp.]HVI57137.1 hypothetical protein [Luteibacter sp.]
MSDTIELLEAIGRDASLRHATSEELTSVLQQAKASDALTAAVASGDSSLLAVELGHNTNAAPQATQTPGQLDGETDPEHDETTDTPSKSDPTK